MSRIETEEKSGALKRLCSLAGLATDWLDIFGKTHQVSDDDLNAVLAALGLSADDDAAMQARISELEEEHSRPAPLVTAELAGAVTLPIAASPYRIELEQGGFIEGTASQGEGGCILAAPGSAGYHHVTIGEHRLTLAVAPSRCYTLRDALGNIQTPDKPVASWGLALQLYSLRRPGDGGVGDFVALSEFAREAASHGAQALAISPVHAQFSADPDRFSPYAPSSRIMLNALHVSAPSPGPAAAALEALPLVDWPQVARDRMRRLRAHFEGGAAIEDNFIAWRGAASQAVHDHALFETLHAEIWGNDPSLWHWRDWPAQYASSDAPGIAAFEQTHSDEISFHTWLQYRADQELAAAQAAARQAGMAVGLVSDLAVGADSGGSHGWSHQGETLRGLTIGAPPDLLQRQGQNWGITAFSARGLRQNGFGGFIEMLRAAMRHAGGVRIDHGMGIARLWIIPDGKTADHGTYLSFPEDDLRRLIKLESARNRAIVLAEDLGTVPEGFQGRLQQDGIDGMRVLMFERTDEGFTSPDRWTPQASAMTSTHDLPPVAGWWSGHDIDERARILGTGAEQQQKEHEERSQDRTLLWQAMQKSGVTQAPMPPAQNTDLVVDCALAHSAHSACEWLMIPVEDALGLTEQPNLPGTVDQHPNWRRRLAAPVGEVLSLPKIRDRLSIVDRIRGVI